MSRYDQTLNGLLLTAVHVEARKRIKPIITVWEEIEKNNTLKPAMRLEQRSWDMLNDNNYTEALDALESLDHSHTLSKRHACVPCRRAAHCLEQITSQIQGVLAAISPSADAVLIIEAGTQTALYAEVVTHAMGLYHARSDVWADELMSYIAETPRDLHNSTRKGPSLTHGQDKRLIFCPISKPKAADTQADYDTRVSAARELFLKFCQRKPRMYPNGFFNDSHVAWDCARTIVAVLEGELRTGTLPYHGLKEDDIRKIISRDSKDDVGKSTGTDSGAGIDHQDPLDPSESGSDCS